MRATTTVEPAWRPAFETHGFAMIQHALTACDLDRMASAFAATAGQRHDRLPADLIQWLALHAILSEIASDAARAAMRLVRIIAFDKRPEANWFVPWHQDRTIAVRNKHEAPGFTKWTVKDGAVHVEPPIEILQQMVTLRLHLDSCDDDSGPLEVFPGSHRDGAHSKVEIETLAAIKLATLCLADRGDALVMRPLLVHRSKRARRINQRRVLHLEYCADPLPHGLHWSLDIGVDRKLFA